MFHHHRRYPLLHSRIGLFILLVLVIIILLFVFGSGSDDQILSINESSSLKDQISAITQGSDQSLATQVTSKDEPCKDYIFEQGVSRTVLSHAINVIRVSSKGAKISIDGNEDLLFVDDYEIYDGFRIYMKEVFYFGVDDPDNVITLRLGCKSSNENPNDKYIREKGENICEDIYLTCKNSFDIGD